MLDNVVTLRRASPDDAVDMAQLINVAGEGLPLHFWEMISGDGQDAWRVGQERARRNEGSFSWRNATVATIEDNVAALLLTYAIDSAPVEIGSDFPSVIVPLQQLENLALDTYYVNVLATYEQYRCQGCGSALLSHAERLANGRQMSIIVSDANTGAMRLYEAHGFSPAARRPIVHDERWRCYGENWVLMLN